jgi:hypothetical protein
MIFCRVASLGQISEILKFLPEFSASLFGVEQTLDSSEHVLGVGTCTGDLCSD